MAKNGMNDRLQTGLTAGSYCNLIDDCATRITVDGSGNAQIVINNNGEPVVAFITGKCFSYFIPFSVWCHIICKIYQNILKGKQIHASCILRVTWCLYQLQMIVLFGLRFYVPVNNFSVMSGRSHRFLGITSTFWEVNVSCSTIQHGDLSEDRTPDLSLRSPTLYH